MKNTLKNIFHFDKFFDDIALERIALSSEKIMLKKGEIIQRNNNDCYGVPLVINGTLRLFRSSKNGREMNIHKVRDGEICVLGALCILTHKSYYFNVSAEKDTSIVLISSACFKEMIEKNLKFNKHIFSILSDKLINALDLHEKVHLSSVNERVENYLKENAENGVVRKTHEQIALDIGSSRVVVSRAIAKLRNEGKISTQRYQIKIIKYS